ncbi:hypothetical protein [Shewanella salipaludis]|uniref:Uncharacterized protein n=1 Tax=Shewanella salipaludis TaxID=2723052 RepID=A0A972JMF7_9GAMM|nr:hypothetical protein [Shewanella salipaludis]NMH66457.1 hypothetical protein [Shewanella salipaludis]
MKIRINCISCGHLFDLTDAYQDYEGPVKCWICGEVHEVKIENSLVKRVGPVQKKQLAEEQGIV